MTDNKNYGLDLLRVLMSFGVVLCHFWSSDLHRPDGIWRFFAQLKTAAVPAFMVMTFLLTSVRYRQSDVGWLKRRAVRLWMPFLFWSLVAWCMAKVLFAVSGTHEVDFGDLVLQLALGANNKVSGQFWFHVNLLMLTFGFFLFFRHVRREMWGRKCGDGPLKMHACLSFVANPTVLRFVGSAARASGLGPVPTWVVY